MLRLLLGDCREKLLELEPESIQCCVTSPPYWSLRDYKVAGQIGLERTPADWLAEMVRVFDGVHRALKPDGVLWVNIGDAYTSGDRASRNPGKSKLHKPLEDGEAATHRAPTPPGMKPKDMVGLPWMLAFALRDRGWYLRSETIWAKRNPMPESTNDRPTKAHEQIFLFSKSKRYYWNAEAMKEPASFYSNPRKAVPGNKTHKGAALFAEGDEHLRKASGIVGHAERARAAALERRTPAGWNTAKTGRRHSELQGRFPLPEPEMVGAPGKLRPRKGAPDTHDGRRDPDRGSRENLRARDEELRTRGTAEVSERMGRGAGWRGNGVGFGNVSFDAAMANMLDRRNRRTVWFAEEDLQLAAWLAEQPGGMELLHAYAANFTDRGTVWSFVTEGFKGAHYATFPRLLPRICIGASSRPGDTVLDPFNGSGTTGQVALEMGRHYVGIELNPKDHELTERRLRPISLGLPLDHA